MFLKSYIFYTKHKKLIFEKIIGGGGAVPPGSYGTGIEFILFYVSHKNANNFNASL